jgi:hypothetical protein
MSYSIKKDIVMKLKEPIKIEIEKHKARKPSVPAGFSFKCKKGQNSYSRKNFKNPKTWEDESPEF